MIKSEIYLETLLETLNLSRRLADVKSCCTTAMTSRGRFTRRPMTRKWCPWSRVPRRRGACQVVCCLLLVNSFSRMITHFVIHSILRDWRRKKTDQDLPPYNGFGSEEDSKTSCNGLEPRPPQRDFYKFMNRDRYISVRMRGAVRPSFGTIHK